MDHHSDACRPSLLRQEREKARKKKQEAMSEEEKKAEKKKSWPKELIFFLRTSELLQGLGSKLNVRHAYMRTMAAAARRGLRESVPADEWARTPVWPHSDRPSAGAMGRGRGMDMGMGIRGGPNRSSSSSARGVPIGYPAPRSAPSLIPRLEQRVRQRLGAMYARGSFLGLQVCVIHENQKLVDVAAGEMGPLNPRPVRPDSLFPCLGASRFVGVALVHALVAQGRLKYEQPIAEVWPEFSEHAKR